MRQSAFKQATLGSLMFIGLQNSSFIKLVLKQLKSEILSVSLPQSSRRMSVHFLSPKYLVSHFFKKKATISRGFFT
jgi:chemotaxis receptor (MCP) glutamine deamidase CheD